MIYLKLLKIIKLVNYQVISLVDFCEIHYYYVYKNTEQFSFNDLN